MSHDYAAEATRTGTYHVGEGDVLDINVWEADRLSGEVTVRPDGLITLQLIGEIRAAGRTPTEIRQEIAEGVRDLVTGDPNVTVSVSEVNSYRIYVVGRVNTPGEFTPDSSVSVLQALALARGLNEYADPNHIVVLRRDEQGTRSIPFVYTAAVKCGRTEMDITLVTGDTVVVP